jgi:hypothetical protein
VSEPVKVLPMAKLLRLAREKEERERAEREALASTAKAETPEVTAEDASPFTSQTIVPQTIVNSTVPHTTIPNQTIPNEATVDKISEPAHELNESDQGPDKSSVNEGGKRRNKSFGRKSVLYQSIPEETISRQTIVRKNIVDNSKGYYPVFNDISDRLIPELGLDPYQQAVLQRLYRLSRGWKSEECEVGLGTLAKYCVMSRSQVQRSLAKLIEKGLVECLGSLKKGGKEGNRYRVLPGTDTIPRQTIPKETIVPETTAGDTIVRQEETGSRENIVVGRGIVPRGTNKNRNKDLKNNTHIEQGVGVGSKFSLEECRRYAEHLQKTGQGINNPGGYATAIHRSGEFDAQIAAFLRPPATPPAQSGCPDCGGTGYFYPEGVDKGVKICKHEKLKAKD